MGPQSQHGAQALTRAARIFAAALTSAAAAAAAETAPFRFADADLRLAWEESAASFVTPSFDDYVAARNQAFIEAVPELFDGGASGAPPGRRIDTPTAAETTVTGWKASSFSGTG